jgi:hypothetical protein
MLSFTLQEAAGFSAWRGSHNEKSGGSGMNLDSTLASLESKSTSMRPSSVFCQRESQKLHLEHLLTALRELICGYEAIWENCEAWNGTSWEDEILLF